MSLTSSEAETLRVCMVLKRPLGAGGMQRQARAVAASLRDVGVRCTIVAQARSEAGAATLRDIDPPITVLRTRSNIVFHLLLARHLLARRREFDLVHVHGSGPEAITAALVAAVAGRPVLVKPSTSGPGTRLGGWARRRGQSPWVRWLLKRGVSRWIAISERTRRELLAARVPAARVAVVPNGVDTTRFRPRSPEERDRLRAGFGVPAGALVITAIARLTPHKRIDLLLRAAADLGPENGALRIWVIGGGREYDRLTALARRLRVPAEFTGILPPEQVHDRLAASDLYVACSQWEGLSNALLEAMACGVTPISTSVSGAEDLIADGKNGRLVPPDDAGALRAAIIELAMDAPARERMAKQARATIVETRDLSHTTSMLLAAYTSALRRRQVRLVEATATVERSWTTVQQRRM